jgi:hypothetical protein
MTENMVELINELVEGEQEVVTRDTWHYDYDALEAARVQFREGHHYMPYYEISLRDGYPSLDAFRYPEPKVIEKNETIDGWYELIEALENAGDLGVDAPGIGKMILVEQYGGEGRGDEYWFVFKVGPLLTPDESDDVSKGRAFEPEFRYFKVDGYYQSYSGGDYDEVYEVFPKQVVRTEWSN